MLSGGQTTLLETLWRWPFSLGAGEEEGGTTAAATYRQMDRQGNRDIYFQHYRNVDVVFTKKAEQVEHPNHVVALRINDLHCLIIKVAPSFPTPFHWTMRFRTEMLIWQITQATDNEEGRKNQ